MTAENPLSLTPVSSDVGHFYDARCGFSMLIPGQPQLVPPIALEVGNSEPTYEALIKMVDVPITLRYRLSALETTADAAATTLMMARTYALNRCPPPQPPQATSATAEQRQTWSTEAAASAIYPLSHPDSSGADMEEVLILYNNQQVLTLTKRFSAAQVSWLSWALWNSSSASSVRLGVSENRSPLASLWPESGFLMPGVRGTLTSRCQGLALRISNQLSRKPGAHNDLAQRSMRLLLGSEAPTREITAEELTAFQRFLGDACVDEPLQHVITGLLSEVRNAHDLRGCALLILHALGQVHARFAEPTATDLDAFSHLAE